MPGMRIGTRGIIGAGSVVTKDVPAGVVAVGNPAESSTIQKAFILTAQTTYKE